MFRYRVLAVVLWVFALTSCTERDRTGVIEPPREEAAGTGRIECTASVVHATLRCVAAAAPAGAPAGLHAAVAPAVVAVDEPITVGAPYVGMEHEVASVAVGANTFSFNARVKNDSIFALGTTDGSTVDADGVRVFFHTGPQITGGGSGSVTVAGGGDGAQPYTTGEAQVFYQYDEIVARGGTSGWHAWQFDFTEGVQTFVFTVYIAARVQYPQGWVDVDPAAFEIAKDATQQLTAVVRDVVGRAQVGAPVTWSSSDEGVATVSGTGLVTGEAGGTATITASSPATDPLPPRTGTSEASIGEGPTATADAYATGREVLLAVTAVDGLLDNDALGTPAATLTHFGGGSLGGTVVSNLAGTTLAPLPGETDGSLTVNAGGDFSFTPPTGFTGAFTFSYRIGNTYGTSDAGVTIDVIGANDVAYPQTVIGNVSVNSSNITPTPFSVTANDNVAADATITFAGWGVDAGVTEQGGELVMQTSGVSRGRFSYNPPAGFTGTDRFTYTVDSDGIETSADVELTVVGMIWFVQDGASACTTVAGGCGRLTDPFSSLAAFAAVNTGAAPNPQENHAIFLHGGTHTGPVTLRAGQKLIGQNASESLATIAGITVPSGSSALPAMGTPTSIGGASGGIVLGSGNTLRGFAHTTSAGTALSGTGFGTLTVGADWTMNLSGGKAFSLNTGSLTATLATIGTSSGLSFTNVSGTLAINGGTVSTSSEVAVWVDGGAGTISYAGSIGATVTARPVQIQARTGGAVTLSGSIASSALGVLVQNNTGGTVTFSDSTKSLTTGSNPGVSLTSNTGASIAFTGGGLALTTTTGAAFTATGGGTVTVEGAGNTINTGTGSALSMNGVAVGGGGLSFATVNTGAAAAPVLLTGVTGGTISVAGGTIPAGLGTRFAITGGTVGVDWGGAIQQSVLGHTLLSKLISITGGHSTGTVSFSGTLSASGLGVEFDNAGGTYNFNTTAGSTTLNGHDAGIDIVASTGTFVFGRAADAASFAITHGDVTSLQAFFINGGTPNVTYHGNITKTTGTGWLVDIFGLGSGGTVTFINGTLNATSGGGILINGGAGPVSFSGTTALSGSARARVGGGSTGAIVFGPLTTVSNPLTNPALDIENNGSATNVTFAGTLSSNAGTGRIVSIKGVSSGSVTVSGSITVTNGGAGILLESNTGGTVTLSNATKTLTTNTNNAVTLTNNSNTAMNFTNGLAIVTTSGHGLVATGAGPGATTGGTLTVSGGVNTIATGGGTALSLTNTTSGGLTFRSISAGVGGATGSLGIAMVNTGTGSGLTVTGNSAGSCGGAANTNPTGAAPYGTATAPNSADCTGGTIQARNGTNGQANGIGVYLNNTRNISLTRMQLSGTHQNFAIRGINVTNLTLSNMNIDGTFGTTSTSEADVLESGNVPEYAVRLKNLMGSVSVNNSFIRGGFAHEFVVFNELANSILDRLTFSGVTFGQQTIATAGAAILVQSNSGNSGTLNVTVQNSRFNGTRGTAISLATQGATTSDFVVQGNVLNNALPMSGGPVNQISGNSGISLAQSNGTATTYLVWNNLVRGQKGTAIAAQNTAGTGTMTGQILNNKVGETSVANSGSHESYALYLNVAGQAKHKVLVDQNTMSQYNGFRGVYFFAGGTSVGTRNGSLHATFRRNTLNAPGDNNITFVSGLGFDLGTNAGDGYTMCLDIGNGSGNANNIVNAHRTSLPPDPIEGVPIDFMANLTTGSGLIYKLKGYPAGTHTGSTAGDNLVNTVRLANGVALSGTYYEIHTSVSATASTTATGVTCDLFS